MGSEGTAGTFPLALWLGDGELCLPRLDEAVGIAEGGLVQRAAIGHALQPTARAAERKLGPVMGREGRPAGTTLERTGIDLGAAVPPVGELVRRRGVGEALGMRRQVGLALVELLPVHVRVWAHRTALHGPVDPEGQMPRVHALLGIHLGGCSA